MEKTAINQNNKQLRVLIVEDSDDDKELILLELRRSGYTPIYENVQTAECFEHLLENNEWDLILCDYSMPNFDGISALSIRNQKKINIPFILISGALNEEIALKAKQFGANDFLRKDNLGNLKPLIAKEFG